MPNNETLFKTYKRENMRLTSLKELKEARSKARKIITLQILQYTVCNFRIYSKLI